MTVGAKSALFLSSFAPLFVVFALLDSFGKGTPTKLCVAVAILGCVFPLFVFAAARKLGPEPLRVVTSEARDADVLAYLASYLVPFAAVAAHTGRQRVAMAVFVIMIAVLYVRTELFYVNPILALVGCRLFRVSTPAGASVMLITRRPFVPANSAVEARRLANAVFWETG